MRKNGFSQREVGLSLRSNGLQWSDIRPHSLGQEAVCAQGPQSQRRQGDETQQSETTNPQDSDRNSIPHGQPLTFLVGEPQVYEAHRI